VFSITVLTLGRFAFPGFTAWIFAPSENEKSGTCVTLNRLTLWGKNRICLNGYRKGLGFDRQDIGGKDGCYIGNPACSSIGHN